VVVEMVEKGWFWVCFGEEEGEVKGDRVLE